MTTTINLHNYTPDNTDPNAPIWPTEIAVAENGICECLYADGQTASYETMTECLDAHELHQEHIESWLAENGRVYEAGQLAMAVAVVVGASSRVSRLTHDSAVYERLDIATGEWNREALLEVTDDGRLYVVSTDMQLALEMRAQWMDASSGEGVDRLLVRGLIGGAK